MFNIFLDRDQPRQNNLNSPMAETIKRQFDFTEKVFTDYYARSGFRLPNNHILVQALRALSQQRNSSTVDAWYNIFGRSNNVARHFGFCAPNIYGVPHKETFYGGKNFSEYIINTTLVDVDPFSDPDLWRHASPFRVLYHPVVDLHFLPPNGFDKPYKNDFSVVICDLNLLALQFHSWRVEQLVAFGSEALVSPEAFLVRESIPRIFRSHFNLAIINNVFCQDGYHSKESVKGIGYPPISFPDFGPRVEPMTKSIHSSMSKRGDDYARVLGSIPLPYNKNALHDLILPRVSMTQQMTWVYWLSRFRYILELLRLGGDRGIRSNRSHISRLKRDLGYALSDKIDRRFNNKDLVAEFEYFSGYVMNL